MTENYTLKQCMTDNPSQQIINDFKKVVNSVFNNFLTDELFDIKFQKNIYGPSMILVVYHEERAIAADALWRNDIGGKEAYQTVDTCVIPEYRGRGVMSMITKYELQWVGERLYYGFPNRQSHPAYLKIGLTEKKYYKTIFLPLQEREEIFIKPQYAQWWLASNSSINYIKIFRQYFLTNNRGKGLYKLLIGRVDKKTALLFPKLKKHFFLPVIINDKKKRLLPSKPFISAIYNKEEEIFIPTWTLDAI